MIAPGEVWWADLGEPVGSGPAFRQPVVVVQSESFTRSRIATVVCASLTNTMKWADAPGNMALKARSTGLDRDSVANVSQTVTLDRAQLGERVGKVTHRDLDRIINGIGVVLGRPEGNWG